PSFSVAAQKADDERLPVVEGITIRVADDAKTIAVQAATQAFLSAQLGGEWQVRPGGGGWLDATPPPAAAPPPLGRAWDAARVLAQQPGIVYAEPLLLLRVPGADDQEVNARLGIWGLPYDPNTAEQVATESEKRDWSLRQLRVPDAWAYWRERHGG